MLQQKLAMPRAALRWGNLFCLKLHVKLNKDILPGSLKASDIFLGKESLLNLIIYNAILFFHMGRSVTL